MFCRIDKHPRLIFAALVLLEIFCWIEVDLYAPAFPQIRRFFGTSEEMIQWTLSLNFLGYFISSLFVGPLADSLGRRPVLLGGSLLFVLGSLLCVLAPSLDLLLVGRLVQGAGVSAPTILAVAVIADLYQGDRQIKLFSLINSLITITMAAAPVLGAWLSESFGWRANFITILAGSGLATVAVFLILPESHPPERRSAFSLKQLAQNYRTLLGSGFFLATAFGIVLLCTPYFVFISIIPFLFMETLGLPMAQYVYYQGAVVGLFALGSLAVPLLIGRVDPGRMTVSSVSLCLGAALLLCLQALFRVDAAMPITALMCLFVVGLVWPCGVLFAMVFAAFPELKGSASALFSALRMMVMAGAISLSGHFYDDSFRPVGTIIFLLALLGAPLLLYARHRGVVPADSGITPVH